MRALHRKLLRDFWWMRGQSLAIAVVIAGGGPTGLMLAGELALAGVDVAIVESDLSIPGHPEVFVVGDRLVIGVDAEVLTERFGKRPRLRVVPDGVRRASHSAAAGAAVAVAAGLAAAGAGFWPLPA